MAIWFQIAILSNLLYWSVFLYSLATRRARLTKGALAVGVLHMLFAALLSVAPSRSWLDPNYGDFGLGFLRFNGRAATLPATMLLAWSLASAWLAAAGARGRRLALVLAFDLFNALNFGVATLVEGRADNWKIQLGEKAAVTGLPAALVLLTLFALPFAASALWAARRTRRRTGDPRAPSGDATRDDRGRPRDHQTPGGLRYSALAP
ncbi:MAG TPA: hypothetical protein VM864_03270 [Pyrinomonadaceae bacterium]|jgi:hypothetical protein|nr:hypothetical protein [Pyrinomonadaceae bacterium]